MTDTRVFQEPTRQSSFAIVVILYNQLRILFRQLIPLIAIAYFGGSTGRDILLYLAIGGSVFYTVWSIISYFKFYFYLADDELNIRKGILRTTKLNIPFERIQTVNFKQNLVHRLFKVVELEIDTAGSKGKEFSFDALSLQKAEKLRSILLSGSKTVIAPVVNKQVESSNIPVERKSILSLDPLDLIKIGVSENHIRSLGLIFVALIWVLEYADDFGYTTEDVVSAAFDRSLQIGLVMLVAGAFFVLFIGFIISLVRTIFGQFNLHLWREGKQYKLIAGLFTRRESTILHRKLQIMEWSDNPIRRLFGIYDVLLKQASSVELAAQKSIRIPGCYQAQIDFIRDDWLGKYSDEKWISEGVSIHYFYRRVLFRMIAALGLLAGALYFGPHLMVVVSIALIPYFIWTSWLSYQKAGYALSRDLTYVNRGMFGNRSIVIPNHKIQSISIAQTPYQSRRDLANLILYSASGSVVIPYLSLTTAKHIQDYLLYKIESSTKKWM